MRPPATFTRVIAALPAILLAPIRRASATATTTAHIVIAITVQHQRLPEDTLVPPLLRPPPLSPAPPSLVVEFAGAGLVSLHHVFLSFAIALDDGRAAAEIVPVFEAAACGTNGIFLPADVALPEPAQGVWRRGCVR